MRIINECYGIEFGDSVRLYHGDKVVEHRKVKASETELEVAMNLIEHYKQNGGYNEWLKIDRMVEGVQVPLKYMKSDTEYLQYLNGRTVRALNGLREKLLDTPLNDMFRKESV